MQTGPGQLGRVSPEERQRKTLELLAKHAAEWETQTKAFEQTSKIQTKKPHKSVMFMDHEWRERQRQLARAEQDQRRDQQMSWEHSLRFNEKLVELRLGRINPIVSVRSQADTDYALQAVLNMPEYVPVDQRIPSDLLQQKTQKIESMLKEKLQADTAAEEDRIDLPLGFDLAPSDPSPQEEQPVRPTSSKTLVSTLSTVSTTSRATKKLTYPTDKRQSVSTTVLDNFVAMIERQQDVLQENQVVAGLRSNLINTQAFEEPYIFADECPAPEVSISAVNLTFVEAYPAELRISNTGDYLMQVELKSKDLKAAKIQVQKGGKLQEHAGGRPMNGNLDSPISRTTYVSKYGTSQKQLTTLSLLKGKASTFGQMKHRGDNDSSRPNSRGSGGLFSISGEEKTRRRSRRASIVPGTQVTGGGVGASGAQLSGLEYQIKILEKAQTPSHLKVLADRFGKLENKKLLLNSYNNVIDIPCGETVIIKFFMPTRVNDRAGTISQEYELIVRPPANCIIESGQMCTIKHEIDHTMVPIVCNGVNTNALGVYKELISYAQKGDNRVQKIATMQKCRQMLWEMADQVVDEIEAKKQQEQLDREEEQKRAKTIQKAVVDGYQRGTLRCTWIKDYTERKAILYAMWEQLLGKWVKCQDLVHMQRELIMDFKGEMHEVINYEYGYRDIFYNLTPLQYVVNQSESQILLQAHNSVVLTNHFKLIDYKDLNDYQRNLMEIINKRIISGPGDSQAKFTLDSAKTTEQRVLQIATSTSPTAVISYHEMSQNKLSQKLLNIVLRISLQFICRQLKIGNQISRLEVHENGVNELIAPQHVGFDGRLLNLLYLAGSCTVLEPVFDCLEINRYGQLTSKNLKALGVLVFLLDILEDKVEESPIDEAGAEFLKQKFAQTAFQEPERTLRDELQQLSYEQLLNVMKSVADAESRQNADEGALTLLINSAKYLKNKLIQQDKTLDARIFIVNVYLLDNIEVSDDVLDGLRSEEYIDFTFSGQSISQFKKDRQVKQAEKPTLSKKSYKWICEEIRKHLAALEEQKAKGAKKPPAKDAAKGAPAKQPPTTSTEMPKAEALENPDESLQDIYKRLLNTQRPESAQKAQKGQKPPPKTLTAITEFKGRTFKDTNTPRNIIANIIGTDRPKLNIQGTMVDIAMLAIKLQACPDHQIFDQIVEAHKRDDYPEIEQQRLEKWETDIKNAEIEKIKKALERAAEQNAQLAASGAGKDRKGAKTPQQPTKGKGAPVTEEVDEALEKAKVLHANLLSQQPLIPLQEIFDLDAVLIQQKYVKELKKLTWLKEHNWLGDGASGRSASAGDETNNMDFLLLDQPEKEENNKSQEKPKRTLHQLFSSSQILNLPFDTDGLKENSSAVEDHQLMAAFKRSNEMPALQLSSSSVIEPEQVKAKKKQTRSPMEEIQHQIRLKFFKHELYHFIDAIFTEDVENACKAHYDSLVQYEDEMGVYERVQFVKQGQMRPEELGMTMQEIQNYPEPRRPQPADYFGEYIEMQKELDGKLNDKVRKFFKVPYDYEAAQLLGFAAAKALRKLQQAALAQLRQVYDEATFKEVENNIQQAIDAKIDSLNNKPSREEVVAIFAMFDITLVFPATSTDPEAIEALNSVLQAENRAETETAQGEEVPAGPVSKVNVSTAPIQHFLANKKLIEMPDDGAHVANNELLMYIADVRDNEKLEAFEGLDIIEFDFHANYKIIEQLVSLPDPKKKPDPKKGAPEPPAPAERPIEIKSVESDEGEEEEEIDEEKLPGLYKPVEQDVEAQREVWAWLFTNALERASVLAKFADDLADDVQRAYNYVQKDISELVQE